MRYVAIAIRKRKYSRIASEIRPGTAAQHPSAASHHSELSVCHLPARTDRCAHPAQRESPSDRRHRYRCRPIGTAQCRQLEFLPQHSGCREIRRRGAEGVARKVHRTFQLNRREKNDGTNANQLTLLRLQLRQNPRRDSLRDRRIQASWSAHHYADLRYRPDPLTTTHCAKHRLRCTALGLILRRYVRRARGCIAVN